MTEKARWWEIRRAQNRKPATYRCPLCGHYLPALSEHMLVLPEGDRARRRHAHTDCVMTARRAGRLPSKDEWLHAQRRSSESPPRAARGQRDFQGAEPRPAEALWRRAIGRLTRGAG